MKRILSREEILEYKKSTNMVLIGNDISLSRNGNMTTININNGFIEYKKIIINDVEFSAYNTGLEFNSEKRYLCIYNNEDLKILQLKDNEYLLVAEVHNEIHIKNEKYSEEINIGEKEIEYPILKTSIEQDYNGMTIGKISIKINEDQLNNFYIYGTIGHYKNDFNKIVNEISYMKDVFENKIFEISELINKYENCFIVYNQKVYKIIELTEITVKLFLLNSTDLIFVDYIDLVRNGFTIINENSLFSYNNNFYLDINGDTLDERDFNVLSPKFEGSKLEQVLNMFTNITESYNYNLNINIIKDMIRVYRQCKEEFIGALNEFEKRHLDYGIYYITDKQIIHLSTYIIEQFDKKIEDIEKEEE